MSKERLSDVVAVLESGSRPKGGVQEGSEGVLSLGAEHLDGGGGFDFSKAKRIPKDYFNQMKKGRIARDDILVVKDGATTGKTSFVGVTFPDEPAAVNEHVFIVRVDRSRAFPAYVFRYLRSPRGQLQVLSDFRGATVGGVSRGFVDRVKIPLPLLPEQWRIAAILDKADAVRRKRQQTLKLADQFLRSAFLNMFGAATSSEYPSVPLDDVCTKITDGAHQTPTYREEGVPFLRVTDIQSRGIKWNNVKRISREEHEDLTKRCLPERGDVLYSKNGTIGIPKLVNWDQLFSMFVSLALLKPDRTKLRGAFLESFLATPLALRQATMHSKTLTVTNLHLVEIRKIRMPLPPLHIQDEWLRLKREITRAASRYADVLGEAVLLFESLTQRAFRGELSASGRGKP